jgi:iron complex transport system ATP-binding protein
VSGAPAVALAGVSVVVGDARGGGDQAILRDVDLRVEPGEHHAVVGPNGAGKSTLLELVAGRVSPTTGAVTVLGSDHDAEGLAAPGLRIGVLDAVPPPFAHRLSALEAVRLRSAGPIALMGERPRAADAARARELLALFGCEALAGRRFRDCSQGERRRIMLARSLMRDPALLLLDEPAGGLDLPGREALLQALARLAEARPALATLSVTHHIEELPCSTTHAVLLRAGAVVAAGAVGDVLRDEPLSACFGVGVRVERLDGRWTARVA